MMSTQQTVKLSGRVLLDDGIYTVVFDQNNWCTCGGTLEEALRDVSKMVLDYIHAYASKGLLESYLVRLGAQLPLPSKFVIEMRIDCSAIFDPTTAPMFFDKVSYPVAADGATP